MKGFFSKDYSIQRMLKVLHNVKLYLQAFIEIAKSSVAIKLSNYFPLHSNVLIITTTVNRNGTRISQ